MMKTELDTEQQQAQTKDKDIPTMELVGSIVESVRAEQHMRSVEFAHRCDHAASLPEEKRRTYWQLVRYRDICDGAMRSEDWSAALTALDRVRELQGVLDVE
jgi:hypothetical protein